MSASTPAQMNAVPPKQPTVARPFKSALSGGSVLPNLYWTAIPHVQLRKYHPTFVGLPDVQELNISTPKTFRYVRQQHQLWSVLRQGRLTTASLNAALGFQEAGTSTMPGVSKYSGSMAGAYINLLEPAWQPTDKSAEQADTGAELAALMHNEAARLALFQSKQPLSSIPADGVWSSAGQESPQARKQQVCEQVGLQGEVACRLYWGTVQEGASLHALSQVFPQSFIEEVGMMDGGAHTLPATWQHDPSELPPLGASPDGLICHWIPVNQEQMSALRLEACGSGAPPAHPSTVAAAEAAALKLLLSSMDTLDMFARQPDSSATTPTTAVARPQLPGSFKHAAPLTHTNQDSVTWLAGLVMAPDGRVEPATHTSAPGSGPFRDAESGVVWVPWREVVECKNHSPFTLKEQRKGRRGSLFIKYGVREYSPLQKLRPSWLPQLQWHCMSAGTHSALLVSRTPSKGISVFRVKRDDDFLNLALSIIRFVHVAWSGRGLTPPSDVVTTPELHFQHRAAVSASLQLAGQAQLLSTIPGHADQSGQPKLELAPGADANALWQPISRKY